ncbi:uncharacterized protein [Primulina eburnea]|uniref:uncharacterized protein n=1 Tax=Primulina eburnea TaxID=1245227 RepID=UPI003C6CB26E
MIALATATSGVAASILPGGRTDHSRFKIPIDLCDKSYCRNRNKEDLQSYVEKHISSYGMRHRWQNGGKVVVLGGDFTQVLAVVPKASVQETINASLVKSYLYEHIYHLTHLENMQARSDPLFSDFLLRVGNGIKRSDADGNIKIPDDMIIKYDDDYDDEDSFEQKLIDHIFPNLEKNFQSADYMTNRALLASKNEYIDKLNDKIIQSFPGKNRTFTRFDEAFDDTQNFYPPEFLNSLTPNGMPPHRLVLKNNCTIMLLRNIDPSDGLCNGTRMACRGFQDNVIHAESQLAIIPENIGFILRIPLSPAKNEGYPFQFRRKQFQFDCVSHKDKIYHSLAYIYSNLYFHMNNYMLHYLEDVCGKLDRCFHNIDTHPPFSSKEKATMLVLKVLRQGSSLFSKANSKPIRKIIFLDEEGPMIYEIVFANAMPYVN